MKKSRAGGLLPAPFENAVPVIAVVLWVLFRKNYEPDFTSKGLDQWAYLNGVALIFSLPVQPMDNAAIQAFNGRFRQEFMVENGFLSQGDPEEKAKTWRRHYNRARPHSALGNLPPRELTALAETGY